MPKALALNVNGTVSSYSNETIEAMANFFQHSFADLRGYNDLTPSEKRIISEEQWEEIHKFIEHASE